MRSRKGVEEFRQNELPHGSEVAIWCWLIRGRGTVSARPRSFDAITIEALLGAASLTHCPRSSSQLVNEKAKPALLLTVDTKKNHEIHSFWTTKILLLWRGLYQYPMRFRVIERAITRLMDTACFCHKDKADWPITPLNDASLRADPILVFHSPPAAASDICVN
jgi:hypothetical protein